MTEIEIMAGATRPVLGPDDRKLLRVAAAQIANRCPNLEQRAEILDLLDRLGGR